MLGTHRALLTVNNRANETSILIQTKQLGSILKYLIFKYATLKHTVCKKTTKAGLCRLSVVIMLVRVHKVLLSLATGTMKDLTLQDAEATKKQTSYILFNLQVETLAIEAKVLCVAEILLDSKCLKITSKSLTN